MQKIFGRYYAEYDHETRLWSILRREYGTPRVYDMGHGSTVTPIRYPVIVKLWFPRWVSAKLLRL